MLTFHSRDHLSRIDKLIIIMKICKVPTLQLKVLNKHSITHIKYIEMENVISNKKEKEKKKLRD